MDVISAILANIEAAELPVPTADEVSAQVDIDALRATEADRIEIRGDGVYYDGVRRHDHNGETLAELVDRAVVRRASQIVADAIRAGMEPVQ